MTVPPVPNDLCDFCGELIFWNDPEDVTDDPELEEGWHTAEGFSTFCPANRNGYHLVTPRRKK
jgi:hypothetical protein